MSHPDDARPAVLIAVANEAHSITQAAVALENEVRVNYAANCAQVLEMAKRERPIALVLDATLPGDALSCLRIIKRHVSTRDAVVVLVCDANMSKLRLKDWLALGVADVVIKPLTVTHLVQRVRVATARALASRAPAESAAATAGHVPGNNSLLVRQIFCPLHDERVPFHRYILRSGKITTESSFFDIPLYGAPVKGADAVNHHFLNVAVCPVCHFASNEPAYFHDPADKRGDQYNFDHPTVATLADAADDRLRKCELAAATPELFTHRRSADEAILSYRLAIDCSRIIYRRNRYTIPHELVRTGNYHLRLAHLLTTLKDDAATAEKHYRAAMENLKEAFLVVEGPNLFKAIYQLVAIAVHFGEDAAAYKYIARLTELDADATIPEKDRAALQRYLARCQKAWEDRDLHRGPSAVVEPAPSPHAA